MDMIFRRLHGGAENQTPVGRCSGLHGTHNPSSVFFGVRIAHPSRTRGAVRCGCVPVGTVESERIRRHEG